ncbi:MAG: hypothetical protein AAGB31_07320 [Bdellovibrio sp.]
MNISILLKKQTALLLFALLWGGTSTAVPLCENALTTKPPSQTLSIKERLSLVDTTPSLPLSRMLDQMKADGRLLYQGTHQYKPGTEFLASNEFDWLATPFDNQSADVLIAFGTNSAWEIAVNKNVKRLYLADWSPYPLLTSAYLITPLIRIAKTPHHFITLLSGRVPNKNLEQMPLDDLFLEARQYTTKSSPDKTKNTRAFLQYLASQKISDFELEFLTSYFWALNQSPTQSQSFGPFQNIRSSSFARILNFYDQRYSPSAVSLQNSVDSALDLLARHSVFSSQTNFAKLRTLFVNGNVQYAMTSITDLNLYQNILLKEKKRGSQSYALSITNIFDCDYAGLSETALFNYMFEMRQLFSTPDNPLIVFRTIHTQPPHLFHRYVLEAKEKGAW